MTETVEEAIKQEEQAGQVTFCSCEAYARATERAALAGARWLGRADQQSAEEAAFSGMEAALAQFPISGQIVIGGPEG